MRLKLRFLASALVAIALGGSAIYLMIELREFLEENFFSSKMPEFLHVIYAIFGVVVAVVIGQFIMGKPYAELMELEKQKKTRRKRESEIEDS